MGVAEAPDVQIHGVNSVVTTGSFYCKGEDTCLYTVVAFPLVIK